MSVHSIVLSTCIFLASIHHTVAQPPPAEPQSNLWRAPPGSPVLADIQAAISGTKIDKATAQAAEVAAAFERSNWAGGSVSTDPFYKLGDDAANARPGDVLKVEEATNTTLYTVPPNVALSRFQYQTKDLNGTSVPASAFVLWPWSARKFSNVTGAPVIAWAHGTSGSYSECAPSHIQNLWYHNHAPFQLALMGYAVVAPDYAGLGINATANGTSIPHQWTANPAAANDLMYAVTAAQKAWKSRLSSQFVVFGHSQGGGAAWAAAERQARDPVPGYLGTVAASPLRDLSVYAAGPAAITPTALAYGAVTAASVFEDFRIDQWVTDEGRPSYDAFERLQGCQNVGSTLFTNPSVSYVQPKWNETYYLGALKNLTAIGGKAFKGPLLVLQGTKDTFIDTAGVTELVQTTCDKFAKEDSLRYAKFEGSDHVPTLYASQQYWLQWIEDRFSGKEEKAGCQNEDFKPASPAESYQPAVNSFMQLPLYPYETA